MLQIEKILSGCVLLVQPGLLLQQWHRISQRNVIYACLRRMRQAGAQTPTCSDSSLANCSLCAARRAGQTFTTRHLRIDPPTSASAYVRGMLLSGCSVRQASQGFATLVMHEPSLQFVPAWP